MSASDGEILTLRPDGFPLDLAAIAAYLDQLPGVYRHSATSPWALVAPPSDLPRLIADPIPAAPRPGDPQFVLVSIDPDKVWIHPGHTPRTWARAQRLIGWLLGLGPWRVTGENRELGTNGSESEQGPTRSPPLTGELTSLLRTSGDPQSDSYFHTYLRVHDSGAFSCRHVAAVDEVLWEGRLAPDLATRWPALVAHLDFTQSSPGPDAAFDDPVVITVERSSAERRKTLDAHHPPPSFAALVHLLDRWAHDLLDETTPPELTDVRMSFPRDAAPASPAR